MRCEPGEITSLAYLTTPNICISLHASVKGEDGAEEGNSLVAQAGKGIGGISSHHGSVYVRVAVEGSFGGYIPSNPGRRRIPICLGARIRHPSPLGAGRKGSAGNARQKHAREDRRVGRLRPRGIPSGPPGSTGCHSRAAPV